MVRSAFLVLSLGLFAASARSECVLEGEALNRYESEILAAAEAQDLKKMAPPLVCLLQMHTESEGFARYLSSSYLRPLFGGEMPKGLQKDPRMKLVAEALEKLTLRSSDVVQKSFLAEFSRGDWRFYTLFCEEGNTEFCSVFLPSEKTIQSEPPLLAAASLMRLRKAYQVLEGPQRKQVERRLRELHQNIPADRPLQRKVIDQIYQELFSIEMPMSLLS